MTLTPLPAHVVHLAGFLVIAVAFLLSLLPAETREAPAEDPASRAPSGALKISCPPADEQRIGRSANEPAPASVGCARR
jgi:hypothetical protein